MVAAGAAFAAAAAAARRRPKRPRALLLLLPMAAAGLLSSSRPAAVAAFLHHHPSISILRQQPRTAATTIRHRSTATVRTNAGNGARDFSLDIPDTTLPDSPIRRVHVLDTGAPPAPTDNPPLVLIGGTAQVINSWVGHTSFLARERRFIIYEARGQGRTELDLAGASMPAHVEDFKRSVGRTASG